MRQHLATFSAVFLVSLVTPYLAVSADTATTGDNVLLKEVERFDDLYLVETRQTCAEGKMAAIKADMDKDKRLKSSTALPAPDIYCRKILTESKRRGHLADLYINLALQEQGYSSLHFAQQAQLLKNNESGRTLAAVLQAANAGQPSYTSITGKPRDLPCPLALDAGFAWGAANAMAAAPVTLTEAEANTIALQCYDVATTTITIHGIAMPASKAGLIAGAWLAKQ
ncbi:hypothetical protein [Asticcacaulis sp. 201]|uniref:hypothetical protein n=1 Tax=Asticcacaulis sp. 201 TaxID=3028787 RepID=UPI0029162415|nr:hypothetical protein [Asticcacaulis sp. 201]MDV6333154.1 hypothetical protein [Asticcacaulis sp. 201]